MQIAADLASKSSEARQRESQQVKPVIQVGHGPAQLHWVYPLNHGGGTLTCVEHAV